MRGLFVTALGMKQVSHGKGGQIHGENQNSHDEPKQHHQQRFNTWSDESSLGRCFRHGIVSQRFMKVVLTTIALGTDMARSAG